MTQIRPRLDGDLAARIQAYASQLSRETGIPVSFNTAVTVLLTRALEDRNIPPASREGDKP